MESFIIVFAVGLTLLLALVIGRLLNWRIPPMSRRIVEIVFLVGLLPLIVLLRLWALHWYNTLLRSVAGLVRLARLMVGSQREQSLC
jgi:hypothetical protein